MKNNKKKLKIPGLAELGLIALVWQLFPGSGKAPGQCLHSNQDTARARRPARSQSQGGQGSIVPRNKWQRPEHTNVKGLCVPVPQHPAAGASGVDIMESRGEGAPGISVAKAKVVAAAQS